MELTEEVKSEILECMDYWKKEMIDNFKTLQDLIKDVKEEEIMECIPRFGYRIRGLDNYNLRNFPFCRIANDNYAICDYAEVLNILKMTNKTFVVYIDAHFQKGTIFYEKCKNIISSEEFLGIVTCCYDQAEVKAKTKTKN